MNYSHKYCLMCTDAQWSYIRILMNEGFVHHCKELPPLDVHHMPTNYTKQQAFQDIETLKALKSNGWMVGGKK